MSFCFVILYVTIWCKDNKLIIYLSILWLWPVKNIIIIIIIIISMIIISIIIISMIIILLWLAWLWPSRLNHVK